MTERWLPVVGYEGLYEVSSDGGVRSLDRRRVTARGYEQYWPGKILKPFVDTTTRYLCVNLGNGRQARKLSVHTLVLEAFVSKRPDGLVARHLNGNRQDPRLINLRWGTYKENAQDRFAHGTNHAGERSPAAKLTVEQVQHIRRSRESSKALAATFGVASSTVRAVRLGQNWWRQA